MTVTPSSPSPSPGWPRLVAATALSGALSTVWAHALAALLVDRAQAPAHGWALPLTLAALALGAVGPWLAVRRLRLGASLALAAGGALSLLGAVFGPPGPWLALLPTAVAGFLVARLALSRMPASLDGLLPGRRLQAGLWLLLVGVALLQVARLSTWISDPESNWFLTTTHPFWAKHECMSAYLHGSELSLRGEPNVYAAEHYPGLNPKATPHTEVADMVVEDPYQYAPQFLLLPALALSFSQDYPTLRAVWFALQFTALLAGVLGLCLWLGGRAGRVGLWLSPLALSAFPVLHDLQYGQFHLAAVGLAVTGMVAMRGGHVRTGGALLASATLSKLFPGVLLIVLLAQRRYRELAWTGAFAVLLTLATLAVFGAEPFVAFLGYHLPRLQSGDAFAFGQAWPEVYDMVLVANQGVYGLMLKLGAMGVAGAATAAVWVNRLYAIALAAGAFAVGLRLATASRERAAIAWLSLVGLASMMSTGAFADYVPATATTLAILVAHRLQRGPARYLIPLAWALQYTLLGTTPLGSWFDASVLIPASALSAISLLGFFGWSLAQAVRSREPSEAPQPAHLADRPSPDAMAALAPSPDHS